MAALSGMALAAAPARGEALTPPPDLTGWTAVPAAQADGSPIWFSDGRVVLCVGSPKGYLRTDRTFSDFHLVVEWRWVGKPGNSGVFLRGSGTDKVWPRCYEAQLQAGNAGELRANGGAKFHADSPPTDRSQPRLEPSSEKPPGEWNTYDIVCRGGTVTLTVNGVRQNRLENANERSGWIALQSEGGVIEFRRLSVEPLGP
jgi:hypothetical protein